MTEQRFGDWIQTYTGSRMFPLDPHPAEIDIHDIAHSLSNLCRFNGHVKRFYSVAEHSCHVSDVLPAELRLAGLLHDASEAYLCDLPRPIKRSAEFAEQYLSAETKLMRVIAVRFCFEWPLVDAVHKADDQLLSTEALQLMAPLHPDWKDRTDPVDGLILPCWGPTEARDQFTARYFALTNQ